MLPSLAHGVGIVLAFILGACATAKTAETPKTPPAPPALVQQLPKGSLIIGQAKVYINGSDITSRCHLILTDEDGNAKGAVQLDESGYVFARIPSGTTYLEHARCEVGDGLNHSSRENKFEVSAADSATYFGHVRFELSTPRFAPAGGTFGGDAWTAGLHAGHTAAMSGGGMVGALLATAIAAAIAARRPAPPPPARGVTFPSRVTVVSLRDPMLGAYRRRHRRELELPLVVSLAGAPVNTPAVEEHTGPLLSAGAELSGVKLTWLGVAEPAQRRLALRLERTSSTPAFSGCETLQIVLPTQSLDLPLSYKRVSNQSEAREIVQADIDSAVLRQIVQAITVHLKACGLTRKLTDQAVLAGRQVLRAYEARIAKLPDQPANQAATDTPSVDNGEKAAVAGGLLESQNLHGVASENPPGGPSSPMPLDP